MDIVSQRLPVPVLDASLGTIFDPWEDAKSDVATDETNPVRW